jgi:hypothetical protein
MTISARNLGAVRPAAGAAHHGNNLLDRRRIGWVTQTFVSWRASLVVARHGGWRSTMPSRVYRTDSIAPSSGR